MKQRNAVTLRTPNEPPKHWMQPTCRRARRPSSCTCPTSASSSSESVVLAPGRASVAVGAICLRSEVELAVVDAGGEGGPLVRGEDQCGSVRVLAVAHGDDVV